MVDTNFWRRRRQRRQVLYRMAMIVPPVVTVASIACLGIHCAQLLEAAVDGSLPEVAPWPAVVALVGVLVGCAATIFVQGLAIRRRVLEPAGRFVTCLRRIREGDIAFRVHLRRGDLLGEVADELNEVLEWLNENPPANVRRGSDIYEVEEVDVDDADVPTWEEFAESHER